MGNSEIFNTKRLKNLAFLLIIQQKLKKKTLLTLIPVLWMHVPTAFCYSSCPVLPWRNIDRSAIRRLGNFCDFAISVLNPSETSSTTIRHEHPTACWRAYLTLLLVTLRYLLFLFCSGFFANDRDQDRLKYKPSENWFSTRIVIKFFDSFSEAVDFWLKLNFVGNINFNKEKSIERSDKIIFSEFYFS